MKKTIMKIKNRWVRKKGVFDSELTWDLGYYSLEFMRDGLQKYLEVAPKIIDLEYHKIKYKNKIYTQKELMEIMYEKCRILCDKWYDYSDDELYKTLDEYMTLYKKLIGYMWW